MDTPREDSERLFQEIKYLNRHRCSVCGKKLPDNSHFHFGWDESNSPIAVGDCHASNVKRIFRREHHDRYLYEMPEWDQSIWRYLDFVKFVSMIADRALYFCRIDKLGDKYEGAKGLIEREKEYDDFYRTFLREAMRTVPEGPRLSEDAVVQEADRLLKDLRAIGETDRARAFVNCWYESDHKSQAMWRLYGQIGRTITLHSTPQRLIQSLHQNYSVRIGRVSYIDFEKGFVGVNDAFWKKHISFAHEREVRVLYQQHEKLSDEGIKLDCDLEKLISRVVVAPDCEPWFEKLVNIVLKRFNISVEVKRSDLERTPFY